MAVVGTRQATLQIFLCDGNDGLIPTKEQNSKQLLYTIVLVVILTVTVLNNVATSQHDLTFCESAVMLSTDTAAKLLCGLRGGMVVIFDAAIVGSCKSRTLLYIRKSKSDSFRSFAVKPMPGNQIRTHSSAAVPGYPPQRFRICLGRPRSVPFRYAAGQLQGCTAHIRSS
jgi:hypothetical protein